MDSPIPVDLGRIAQDLQIRRVQVESVVQLLDEGNTVPFITRYRKEKTGGLNEVVIREIQGRVRRLRELAERKQTILKAIEAQGKLTEDLAAAIRGAENSKRLEDLYLPYKPKKRTKASDAREKGLEPLALRIWNRDETLVDLNADASGFVDAEKGLETTEKVLEGVGHILAESISELANVRDTVRRAVWKAGKVVTTKAENVSEGKGLDYRDYFNYSEPVAHIPPHRVLAINRGDKENILKVKLDVPRVELERSILGQLPLEDHPHGAFFTAATLDALDRLLMPSLEREVRRDLTEVAEKHAVDVFARNLRSLLLQPPILNQTVLAIDPGFRTGCKVAVLDNHGNLLEHGVIHPHQPQNRRHEAKQFLKDLVGKYQVNVVAIGNGTACRETEELIAEIITEGTHFHQNPGVPFPGPEPKAGRAPAASQAPAEVQGGEDPGPQAEDTPQAAPEAEAEDTTQATPEAEAAVAPPDQPAEAEAASDGDSTPHVEAEQESPAEVPPAEEVAAEPEPAEANGTASEAAEPSPESVPPIVGGAPDDSTAPEDFPPIRGGEPDGEGEPTANPPAEVVEPQGETPNETVPPPSDAPEAEASATAEPAFAEATPPPAVEAEAPAPDGQPEPAEAAASTPPADEPQPSGTTEVAAPDAETAAESSPDESSAPQETPAAAGPALPGATPLTQPPRGPKPKGDQPRPPRPKGPPPPPQPHSSDPLVAKLAYVIVNEAGASVYSASPVGREEFPEFDAELRGTISIGRRLQDPLAELVKIEPQNIGVGLYQHDVNPKQLKESLESVIESCVNFVGVDLNTASIPLLQHVSGLNSLTARRIAEYRKEKGPFKNREQIKEVEGVGPATFTQAAGFLKLAESEQSLDRTWVHPESYAAAEKLLEKLGTAATALADKAQVEALLPKFDELDIPAASRELEVGEPTLRDILDALARPGRDPREDLPKPIFKRGVLKLEDLQSGMELKGTVLNVVDFGAFVDIGLKDSGLVHISQLANRYIKSPHDVVSVGDVVTVWVMGVDQERKRVSLTMVEPGTERPRGERGPRRGPGEGRAEGGEARPPRDQNRDRGGPRGPRGPRRDQAPGPGGGEAPPPEARSDAPRPGTNRIPGPPLRMQQGGGGRGRPGFGRGGPQRGGPGRGPQGRPQEAPRGDEKAPPRKPKGPPQPPPPLSKSALAGSTPLRSFGQLKQLFEARKDPESEAPEGSPQAGAPDSPSPGPIAEPTAPAPPEASSNPETGEG